jgi:hypothetical protein
VESIHNLLLGVKVRNKLTPERIAELDKFQLNKQFDLIRFGMLAGIIPWQNRIIITRKVRKLKTERNKNAI